MPGVVQMELIFFIGESKFKVIAHLFTSRNSEDHIKVRRMLFFIIFEENWNFVLAEVSF